MNAAQHKQALEVTGNYRVLTRLTSPITNPQPNDSPNDTLNGMYVDVETTGLNPNEHEVIQLAMIPFTYTRDGRITRTGTPLNELQEPKAGKIPSIITQITGLTMNDVKGHTINHDNVSTLLENTDLIIAHNAAFDRPFLETINPTFATKPWACSLTDIPWKNNGYETTRLKYLLTDLGYYYDAHDALADCAAGITALTAPLENGTTAMQALLANTEVDTFVLRAINAPFDAKDTLKNRGYKWNPGDHRTPRAWWTETPGTNLDEELNWLSTTVYRANPEQASNLNPVRITRYDRFSVRAPQ